MLVDRVHCMYCRYCRMLEQFVCMCVFFPSILSRLDTARRIARHCRRRRRRRLTHTSNAARHTSHVYTYTRPAQYSTVQYEAHRIRQTLEGNEAASHHSPRRHKRKNNPLGISQNSRQPGQQLQGAWLCGARERFIHTKLSPCTLLLSCTPRLSLSTVHCCPPVRPAIIISSGRHTTPA